ncbi:hypothetical protein PACTADRAFT_49218 [Pachysolen tannophilus NRRL Y-2460]|uniref:Uncharacterized protein n=1 Tax=Pachysolen tannophilus NRRL Y-2460 TaxID=669874 RepID=A0A1E4TVH0_PACTA|nr:hypothetical protein PACTADRAFT_49218 [Pachysolen tannophilus NRRL Y-2460]
MDFFEMEKIKKENEIRNRNLILNNTTNYNGDYNDNENPWKKFIRFRMDHFDLKNLSKPMNYQWLNEGKVDIVADIMFPKEEDDFGNSSYSETKINDELSSLIGGLWNKFILSKTNNQEIQEIQENQISISNNRNTFTKLNKYVVIDLKFQFTDLKTTFGNGNYLKINNTKLLNDDEFKSLIKFINNYNQNEYQFSYNNNDEDNEYYFGDEMTHSMGGLSGSQIANNSSPLDTDQIFPTIKFRVVKNLEDFSFTNLNESQQQFDGVNLDLKDLILVELINNMRLIQRNNELNLINNNYNLNFKKTFFLINNLLIVGLGTWLI